MANTQVKILELRFDTRDDDITHCYILLDAWNDVPLGVIGWHYKAFPARISVQDILTNPEHLKDHIFWPQKAPEYN